MALFLSVGFSFTQYYSDDFQTYGTAQDPAFIQKYLTNWTYSGTGISWNQSIVQAPSDSLAWKIFYDTNGQFRTTNFLVAYNISVLNTKNPFTFSQIIRPDSQIIVEALGNSFEWYFYLFENASSTWDSKAIKANLNSTKGYLLSIKFPYSPFLGGAIDVELSRCASGLSASDTGSWSCPQSLSTSVINPFNNTGMTGYWSGGGNGRVLWSVIKAMRMKVVVESDNTIRLFMNNDSLSDIQRFSYLDTAPLFNFSGGLIQGMEYDSSHSNSYQTGDVRLYVDDLSYLNYSYTTAFGNTTLTQVSYPQFVPNDISLVDRSNNTLSSWIAVNQRFAFQYTFNTPAGLMNPLTELTCPIRMQGEYACALNPNTGLQYCDNYSAVVPDSHDNPQIQIKARTSADANKCVIIDEYSSAELKNYGWLCYGPESCAISWSAKEQVKQTFTQTITPSYTTSGQWKNLYKVLDTNGKLLYISTDIACSAPANISVLLNYIDLKTCAGLNGIGKSSVYEKEYNLTIGIDPSSGLPCDVQLNGTCWNGSTGVPSVPPNWNGTAIPSLENYTKPPSPTPASDAGITNIYDSSQSGGIIDMILSPAFLGMMVCVIVGSAVGYVAGPLVGVCGFIGAIIIATGFGLFPIWISFGIVALTAFATAMLVKAGFTS